MIAPNRQEVVNLLGRYEDDQIRSFYPVDILGEEVVIYQLPDGSGNIRIKILEIIGKTEPRVYKVLAAWGQPGSWFDLEIRKWVNPPPYESSDIWVDSEENGWDNYEHHDPAANPDIPGNPLHNGDRPWVGHDNRVYARVWNHGDMVAQNVRVDFEVMIPPGQTSGYPLDPDFIDIPAGGHMIAETKWRPLSVPIDEHACIVAKAEYRPSNIDARITGELNALNNSAQENITDFYVQKGSPYEPVSIPFEFANPFQRRVEMKLNARGLKPGWTLSVDPHLFTLEAGERMEGLAILAAADSVPLGDADERNVPPVFSLEALVCTGCTWERVGGFSMMAHTVRKSKLRISADTAGGGVYVTTQATAVGTAVSNANIAVRVIGPGGDTVAVRRGKTNSEGRATLLIAIRGHYPAGTTLCIEGRLTPTRKFGPAKALTQLRL